LFGHVGIVSAGLARAGYAPSTVAAHLTMLGLLDRRCAAVHVGLEDLSVERIERLVAGARSDGRAVTLHRLGPVLGILRGAGLIPAGTSCPPDAIGQLVGEYGEFLRLQRRLAPLTIQHRVELAARFCRVMLAGHGASWQVGALQVEDLHGFLFEHASRCSVAGTRTVAETLRCWCRFLFAAGHTHCDLSGSVPAPAGFRQAQLPRTVDEKTVAALFGACDRSTVTGLRDVAVMTLMLRLGMRANEIACLCLEDLHWRTGDIEIAGKGGRRDRLPLPPDVGEAIVAYLRLRPASPSRSVFLRAVAPAGALSRNGVVFIPRTASRRAGLAVEVGAHRLRHTAATRMLRGGASLREVGQVLRHHGEQVTSVYARLDLATLTPVARAWPGAGR
jgi:site-specific recombinase XerC